jgi:hypothetical protein
MITSKADREDARWLGHQVAALVDGFKAATNIGLNPIWKPRLLEEQGAGRSFPATYPTGHLLPAGGAFFFLRIPGTSSRRSRHVRTTAPTAAHTPSPARGREHVPRGPKWALQRRYVGAMPVSDPSAVRTPFGRAQEERGAGDPQPCQPTGGVDRA